MMSSSEFLDKCRFILNCIEDEKDRQELREIIAKLESADPDKMERAILLMPLYVAGVETLYKHYSKN